MTETLTGTDRSAGVSYDELLDGDTRPVPDYLRAQSPMPPGNMRVPASVFYSREFHDLEVELLWKRVWQLACHEDELAEVGDHVVYDIAHLSFLLVRTGVGPDDIAAYRNACLHRGRKLREEDGKRAKNLRCAFHGWCWNLDGSLKEIPCQWDFPSVEPDQYGLPGAQVARWGGLVFINPDLDAEPLEDFLGTLPDHMASLPQERRFKAVHVAKPMRVNWKACQEAFMEAYHVVATHATLLETLGDANTRYDVYENYSRAISPGSVRSPHLADKPVYEPLPDGRMYACFRHPMNGHIYERAGDDLVRVIDLDGNTSEFDAEGRWISGPVSEADPHLCLWIGGKQLPGFEDVPVGMGEPPAGTSPRAYAAEMVREGLRARLGGQLDRVDVDSICDAELIDAIYFSVFPNWHPWGCFNAINYRFRPYGDDPDMSIMEVMLFLPSPTGEDRPPPAVTHWLDVDDDWTEAPELGALAKIFNQDVFNLPKVQAGLKNLAGGEIVYASYNESKPRHFHALLQEWLGVDYPQMLEGTSVDIAR